MLTDLELSPHGESVCAAKGFPAPLICTPDQLFQESNVNDPIVDEVRRIRDEYAARFNYDIDAMFLDLKEKERLSGRPIVSYAKSASEPLPEYTPISAPAAKEAVAGVA